MKKLHYKVAGHLLEINFVDAHNDESVLPSFAPFATEEEGELALDITVDDSFRLTTHGKEVGQFDCGGCNHGVYLMDDGSYQFEVSDVDGTLCSVMESSADFRRNRVAILADGFSKRNFGLNNCVMMAFAFATATEQTLLMHASVIRKDGYAYAMTAPSGTGKSTHTYLWYKNIPGCDLMNDDNPVIRIVDGVPTLFGSPWSGKTPCYRNISAPLGAMVCIKQMPRNEIQQLPVLQAFSLLLPAMSTMKWDKRVYTSVCDTISAVLGSVKVYALGCLPDAEAAQLCYTTVRAK